MSCTLCCALLSPTFSYAECKRAALDLPVTIAGTRPLIDAKINGKDVRLLVDSGAFFSMMSTAASQELQLKLQAAPFGLYVSGVGGTTTPELAVVKVFTLANADIHNIEFLVGGSENGDGMGILGQNFLVKWNVEYDLAKGMIRIFKDTGCSGSFLAYWAAQNSIPYTETSIEKVTPGTPHAIAHAYVNGEKIRVMFDSGAYQSVLSTKAAARAGVKIDSPGVVDGGLSTGVGRSQVRSYIAPFSSFKFADGEEIKNARLRIADLDMQEADMLVGGDFFLSHRIFVANSQDKIYFSYNGGPVFDLRTMDAKTEAKPSDQAKPPAQGSENAAELARRATASAGRHDYGGARADLTRAIELEPNNPDYLYERGRVLWSQNDQPKATLDFDRAIELRPDFVSALMGRAQLRLNADDIPGARADLDTVDKLASKQSDVRYEMAFAYERAELFESAIAQLDLWLAAHGEDARRSYAYSSRCRARGILGRDLAAALKDCNQAVKLGDATDAALRLDNRALIRLRLGDYGKAIDDYDASLKLEPNLAWTYYGRGLAKIKKNQREAGEADIAAAVKLAPKVAGGYQELGLSP